MAASGNTGFVRIARALVYSWRGLRAAFRHEAAFRQELALAAVLLPLAFWLGQDGVERALLVASVLLVLVVELLNSAVEAAIDRFGDDPHPLSARAKDMASAAVLVSLLLAALVWGLVLL
ncbi:diacylglycerol kinase [Thioalkalivibrio sp. ALJT]|uniref:diacylglycerol kinase n=1 Tax=Thioalkalivibrio sp. ALJT TaxID=1158146 RepID=UPI00036DF0B4|nr:diacylglycerol kinase [Thioalkalivibrio sp. ALJT]